MEREVSWRLWMVLALFVWACEATDSSPALSPHKLSAPDGSRDTYGAGYPTPPNPGHVQFDSAVTNEPWIVDDGLGFPENVVVATVDEAAVMKTPSGGYRIRDVVALFKPFFDRGLRGFTHVVTFTDFPLTDDAAPAWALPVASDVSGVGFESFPYYPWDFRDQFGDSELTTIIVMNDVATWPTDPSTPALGPYSSTEVLAQEFAHMAAFYAEVMINGSPSSGHLDRSGAHYAFAANSGPTPLLGNTIRDNGDGTFTTELLERPLRYNLWDLYLLGLADAAEAPPLWFVDGACCFSSDSLDPSIPYARPGITFRGRKVTVTIEDLMAVEGRRVPSFDESRKDFRIGFMLLGLAERPARAVSARRVDAVRAVFEQGFPALVSKRATLETSLR